MRWVLAPFNDFPLFFISLFFLPIWLYFSCVSLEKYFCQLARRDTRHDCICVRVFCCMIDVHTLISQLISMSCLSLVA